MASIIDTSDGRVIINGGAVALPTSAVTVVGPTIGSMRYNTATDSVEYYSSSGAWYTVGSPTFKAVQTITGNTTLTQAQVGNFIICNSTSTVVVTLPLIASLRSLTGFTFDTQTSFLTLATSGSDTISSASSVTVPKGQHITVTGSGGIWYILSDYNPVATVSPYVFESVNSNVVASGINQTGATLLTAKYNVITTVTTGTGVILPVFVNIGVGAQIFVFNHGASTLAIYPPVGCLINGLGTNAPFMLASGSTARLVSISSTLWLTN